MALNLGHAWKDRALLTEHLGNQLALGRLALVLGAGVSMFFGLPSWETLVQRLYDNESMSNTDLNLARAVERLRRAKYLDDTKYHDAVRRALYQGISADFERLRENPTLAAIAALVMNSRRGSAQRVISLNFDDLLETYLEYHGFTVCPIVNVRHWASNDDVRIYHPHGYLPYRLGERAADKLVLDQKSFSEITGDMANPFVQVIADTLRTHTTLFVGSSAQDSNIDAVLVRTWEDHVVKAENGGDAYRGVRFAVGADPEADLMAHRGIATYTLEKWDDLPPFLFAVCQCAARRRK